MTTRILVLFGTTDGHTAKVARALGEAFRAEGASVDIVDAATEVDPRPEDYAATVVAASVHAGGFQRRVGRWVAAHAQALNERPTAFLPVCLGVLEHNPRTDRELSAIIERFLTRTGWRPAVRKLVAGALLYTKYNWLKRWMMRRIVAKAGGETDTSRDFEYTDWGDLTQFARAFRSALA